MLFVAGYPETFQINVFLARQIRSGGKEFVRLCRIISFVSVQKDVITLLREIILFLWLLRR